MAENPIWGDDWPAVRALWTLDPEVAFLNHGSFGACPLPVLEAQAALRAEMEREPVLFLDRRFSDLVGGTRRRIADFAGADAAGTVPVTNATTSASTVLASQRLRTGDEVLLTSHTYPAVHLAAARRCEQTGARLVVAEVPLPLEGPAQVTAAVRAALTERTRVIVIDQITSPTAAIFPVASVVAAARDAGCAVFVDGAHAPGMVPLDVGALGADWWTGNFHKWACAPKGAAALIAAAHRRDIRPLVTSHGAGRGIHAEFDWTGTFDPTAWLCVPAALDCLGGLGWDRLRVHNRALAEYGRQTAAAVVRSPRLVPAEMQESMAIVALPSSVNASTESLRALQARLFDEQRVEVPLIAFRGRGLLRLSAQAYNHPADYERLATALRTLL